MTALTLKDVIPPQKEAAFQSQVVKLARSFGWLSYHPWTSVHSASGWPDLFLVRDKRAIAAELKSARGHLRPGQKMWLDTLSQVPGIETFAWWPSDWPQIVEILR